MGKVIIPIFMLIIPFQLIGDEFGNKMQELSEQILRGIPQAGEKIVVAVNEFADSGCTSGLGRKIAEQLTINLMNSERVTMVDRTSIDKALKEIKIQMTESFREVGAQKMGKMIGADAVICGTVNWESPYYRITAKMVEAETVKIISGGNVIFAPEKSSPVNAGLRSLVLPGLGQFYTGEKRKGSVIMLGELGLGATMTIMAIQYNTAIDYMNEANTEKEKDYYYDRALLYQQVYNYSLVAVIGIWAYSIVDAYVSASAFEYPENMGYLFKKEGLGFLLKENAIAISLVKHF